MCVLYTINFYTEDLFNKILTRLVSMVTEKSENFWLFSEILLYLRNDIESYLVRNVNRMSHI